MGLFSRIEQTREYKIGYRVRGKESEIDQIEVEIEKIMHKKRIVAYNIEKTDIQKEEKVTPWWRGGKRENTGNFAESGEEI